MQPATQPERIDPQGASSDPEGCSLRDWVGHVECLALMPMGTGRRTCPKCPKTEKSDGPPQIERCGTPNGKSKSARHSGNNQQNRREFSPLEAQKSLAARRRSNGGEHENNQSLRGREPDVVSVSPGHSSELQWLKGKGRPPLNRYGMTSSETPRKPHCQAIFPLHLFAEELDHGEPNFLLRCHFGRRLFLVGVLIMPAELLLALHFFFCLARCGPATQALCIGFMLRPAACSARNLRICGKPGASCRLDC